MAKFHARTDIGLKRKHNEDAMVALEDMGVFVVADGVGGRNAGELASSITVNTFQSYAPQFKTLLSEYAADPNLKTRNAILNELHTVANMASQKVYDASHAMSRQGMTTTLVAALVGGGSAFVVHVGDSRAYVVRDGKLRQLTEDHSMVNELLRTGTLTPGDEASKRYRNVITRAVGLYPTVRADTLHIELLKDDRLLLCTDGLSDLVDADAILTLMSRHKLRDAIDNLVDAALGKGERTILLR